MKKREGDIAFCVQLAVLVFLVNILFSLLLQLTGFIHTVSGFILVLGGAVVFIL